MTTDNLAQTSADPLNFSSLAKHDCEVRSMSSIRKNIIVQLLKRRRNYEKLGSVTPYVGREERKPAKISLLIKLRACKKPKIICNNSSGESS